MKIRTLIHLCTSFLLAATAFAQIPDQQLDLRQADTKACLRCHGMANLAYRDTITFQVRNFSVPPAVYGASVHAALQCRSCHDEITAYPHTFAGSRPKVSCGDDCHATNAKGERYTHEKIASEFNHSVHGRIDARIGRVNQDAPTCRTCHAKDDLHGIRKAARSLDAKAKMDLCVECHDNATLMARNHVTTEAVQSYRRSFHFKAIKFGHANTAVCQDCHTVHHVLPREDSSSSIAAGHVARTCGQENCHPGAKMNFALSGANHLSMRIEKEPILWFEENFFLALTAGTLLMLIVGIILDVQKKYGWLATARRAALSLGRPIGRASLGTGRLLKKLLID
jgi:hypothetical protein